MSATYYVNEQHLGSDATPERAKLVVETLRGKGWQIAYGVGPAWSETANERHEDGEDARAEVEALNEAVTRTLDAVL